jgi:hypothetical protein
MLQIKKAHADYMLGSENPNRNFDQTKKQRDKNNKKYPRDKNL